MVNRYQDRICCFALIGIVLHCIVYYLVHCHSLIHNSIVQTVDDVRLGFAHLASYSNRLKSGWPNFLVTLFCHTPSCAILSQVYLHANQLINFKFVCSLVNDCTYKCDKLIVIGRSVRLALFPSSFFCM